MDITIFKPSSCKCTLIYLFTQIIRLFFVRLKKKLLLNENVLYYKHFKKMFKHNLLNNLWYNKYLLFKNFYCIYITSRLNF